MKGQVLWVSGAIVFAMSFFLPVSAVRSQDLMTGSRCILEIEGQLLGVFSSFSGIGSETEVIEQKMVGQRGQTTVQQVPGKPHWLNVTLKRGVSADTFLWEWRKMVEDGKMAAARRTITLSLVDMEFRPVARWSLKNAWPVRVEASQEAGSAEQGVETLVLTHEGVNRLN
jgi:phage tail-like protein